MISAASRMRSRVFRLVLPFPMDLIYRLVSTNQELLRPAGAFMAYKSSPRPTFTVATHIPYAGVTRFLWGDETAGFVDDWIYASTDKIHQLVFGLPAYGA